MGQFEKIVVLTVLFLVSVILVVSMRSEDGDLLATAVDPAAAPAAQDGAAQAAPPAPVRLAGLGSTETEAGGPAVLSDFDEIVEDSGASDAPDPVEVRADEVTAAGARAPGLLLSANIGSTGDEAVPDDEPAAEVAPRGLPRGSALITLEGLEETLPGGDRLYTWCAGDSFAKLARRYYGDPAAAELLRRANEGRGEIAPGEQVWVPLHDERAEGVAVGGAEGDFTLYTIGEGDSLWNIASRHYGSGEKYLSIFKANEDVLVDIDAVLVPGTELRLP